MSPVQEPLFSKQRLRELALRAESRQAPCFTPFLSVPEAAEAQWAAKKEGVLVRLFGGYEDAERQMACFSLEAVEEGDFPLEILELRWPHQSAPTHRDVLGSVLALGIQRHTLGDILLEEDRAYLFATAAIVPHVMAQLHQAGKVHLQIMKAESTPMATEPNGVVLRDTVPSLRLDAVVASGLSVSRAKAAALIEAGRVKLRHLPTLRTDVRVEEGDMISVRGMGRMEVTQVGQPTRKDRLPVVLTKYGMR